MAEQRKLKTLKDMAWDNQLENVHVISTIQYHFGSLIVVQFFYKVHIFLQILLRL